MVLVSLIPQIHFWLIRGSEWHGAYAILQGDETYYSAYINALIDGRPRRNDPFAGQDDHALAPMPESLFSVQFVPPYVIAFLARFFGFSASTAFIILAAVGSALASLAVFMLLRAVTGDSKFSAVGVLVVLCLGTVAGGQGWIGLIVNKETMFGSLLFLRRYLPSAPFPIFFVFCALVFQALTSRSDKARTVQGLLAAAAFVGLVFSYFYLWTAALAWIVCLIFLWVIFRPEERRTAGKVFALVSGPMIVGFLFYWYLLLNVPTAVEEAQVLTRTHSPDLRRIPEIIGLAMLTILLISIRRNKTSLTEPRAMMTASFALLPFVVFNEQVVTGRSIQPYHYEVFILNYCILVGAVILFHLLRPTYSGRVLTLISFLCILWGIIEVNQQFQLRSTFDVSNDEMIPVFQRLRELADKDGTWDGLRNSGKSAALVFSPQYGVSRLLPTWAPQGSLLSPGSAPFQSLSSEIRKEWLYTHLYYCGITKDNLRDLLELRTSDLPLAYFAKSTIFGNERAHLALSEESRPVQQSEIEQEIYKYESFIGSFSRNEVLKRPVAYAVISAKESFNFSNLDRFYTHDAGESIGYYRLYRLKLRE